MQCPVDNTTLVMSDRQGIEIDYCPQCRGVWLDRGEIDKIIERSNQDAHQTERPVMPHSPQPTQQHREYDYDDDDNYRQRGDNHGQGHHKKHKESWFGELFD